MDTSLYAAIADAEDTHWWYLGMRYIFRDFLRHALPAAERPRVIIDVGAGTGGHTRMLSEFGEVTAVEPSPVGREIFENKYGVTPLAGEAYRLPCDDASADLVTMLDVIEHLDDDARALREAYRVLHPGGCVFIFTSAYQILWSRHDEINGHYRRYRRGQLTALLRDTGFRVKRATYINPLLFPPALAVRLMQRIFTPKAEPAFDIFPLPGVLNTLMYSALKPEAWALRVTNFPCGLSLVALAERPAD